MQECLFVFFGKVFNAGISMKTTLTGKKKKKKEKNHYNSKKVSTLIPSILPLSKFVYSNPWIQTGSNRIRNMPHYRG